MKWTPESLYHAAFGEPPTHYPTAGAVGPGRKVVMGTGGRRAERDGWRWRIEDGLDRIVVHTDPDVALRAWRSMEALSAPR